MLFCPALTNIFIDMDNELNHGSFGLNLQILL